MLCTAKWAELWRRFLAMEVGWNVWRKQCWLKGAGAAPRVESLRREPEPNPNWTWTEPSVSLNVPACLACVSQQGEESTWLLAPAAPRWPSLHSFPLLLLPCLALPSTLHLFVRFPIFFALLITEFTHLTRGPLTKMRLESENPSPSRRQTQNYEKMEIIHSLKSENIKWNKKKQEPVKFEVLTDFKIN